MFLGFFFEQKYFLIRAEKMILLFTKYFFRIFYVNPKKNGIFLIPIKKSFSSFKTYEFALYDLCFLEW